MPWFSMPHGPQAERQAALGQVRDTLGALSCAGALLERSRALAADQAIVDSMEQVLARLQYALSRLPSRNGLGRTSGDPSGE